MRADGRRVKNANPMYTVAAYIMNKRNDAQNMIELFIPVDPMHEYLKKKRAEGLALSHLALVMAAYIRTVAEFPELNRFVVNKRIYARNELAVGMVVLKPGETDGTMSKIYFDLEDDVFRVQERINEFVAKNRESGDTNSTDKLITFLLKVPGLVDLGVGLFKLLDRYGLLPKAIIDASPFHTSLVITNLASIRTNHIYHHVYNFGTTGMIIAMGNLREIPTRTKNGVEFVRSMPLGVVMDERICSGSYYAAAFAKMRKYLADPTLLEGAPEVVIREWEQM